MKTSKLWHDRRIAAGPYIRWFILVGILLILPLGCQGPGVPDRPATRVILVRHAEKAGETGDVPLNARGQQRASALAEMLAEAGVDAIYATQYRRNQMTAEPLSQRTGLAVTTLPVGVAVDDHARELANVLKSDAHAGQLIVCIEHSNTIVPILNELGITSFEGLADYPHMFIVTIRPLDPAELLILYYNPD